MQHPAFIFPQPPHIVRAPGDAKLKAFLACQEQIAPYCKDVRSGELNVTTNLI